VLVMDGHFHCMLMWCSWAGAIVQDSVDEEDLLRSELSGVNIESGDEASAIAGMSS